MKILDIELHDLPVDALSIDFELKCIKLKCSVYDEGSKAYLAKEVIFYNVGNVDTSEITIDKLDDIEIYGAERNFVNNSEWIAITFLTGFGKASFKLSFNYATVQFA
jgi:hypothetical protein